VKSVVEAVVSARALIEPPQPAPPELAAIAADLDRLHGAGVTTGQAIDGLVARQKEVAVEMATAAARRAAAHRHRAESELKAAMGGNEEARGIIEALASRSPLPFPADFADAIAGARADRLVWREISNALA
jgi:hypothetical protein